MPVLEFPRSPRATRCYVRLRNIRPDGFVEFDFSIGDPDLSVDLIMPHAAYVEFCSINSVRFLTLEEGEVIDREQAKWRYGLPNIHE
jgi:phenol hydroxylase P0 protein